jgi:hypothetical protein
MLDLRRSGSRAGGELLDLNEHELRWLERCESYQDVDDAPINIILSRGLWTAPHEIRLARRGALKGALKVQAVHEYTHPEAPKQMSRAYRNTVLPLEPIEQLRLELFPEMKAPSCDAPPEPDEGKRSA